MKLFLSVLFPPQSFLPALLNVISYTNHRAPATPRRRIPSLPLPSRAVRKVFPSLVTLVSLMPSEHTWAWGGEGVTPLLKGKVRIPPAAGVLTLSPQKKY